MVVFMTDGRRTEIIFAGSGGQGIAKAAEIAGAAACLYDDNYAAMIPNYGPEARGGRSYAELVISNIENDNYPLVNEADVLVAMNQETYDAFTGGLLGKLKPNYLCIVDEDLVRVPESQRAYRIPATRLAQEEGAGIAANIVMLGFFAEVTGLVNYNSIKRALKEKFPEKFDINERCLEIGYGKH